MTALLTAPYRRGGETLVIPLGTDTSTGTQVPAYQFTEYQARYQDDPPAPRYVLFPLVDTGPDPLTIDVDFSRQGQTATATLTIPPRTFAMTSFVIPTPIAAAATLRILRFRQSPAPLPGAGSDNFGLVALLGNIAKLGWVIGWEKDQARRLLRQMRQERSRGLAHGFSLDLLGRDLRVPRFPSREYSFDPDAIALYHLNDPVAANGPVIDETAKFNKPGHPGVNAAADSQALGKFGSGFRFPGSTGSGSVTVAHDAEFNVAADAGFTVELFVKADPRDDPAPRFIIRKGNIDAAGTLTSAGWSLAMATVHRITNNVRWAVSDGTNAVAAFADVDVADGRFHHLAGIVDRTRRRARLFLDGKEVAATDLGPLGAIANGVPITIGSGAAAVPFAGVVDEVRLSRVARSDFHPVLGESDDSYRRRLGIFQRWFLPTPGNLLAALNSLVQVNNDPQSFILIEKTPPGAEASQAVQIVPAALPLGQSIDDQGNLLALEADSSGRPEAGLDFNPIFLVTHSRPKVTYGADPNNALMQAVTAATLDALVDRLAAAQPPVTGNLVVVKSYDPTDAGLHRVGRALRLKHDTLQPDVLGALAHRAGFTFVRNANADVYASVALGEKLAVSSEPPAVQPPAGSDVLSGTAINLGLVPAGLPAAGRVSWTLILTGSGRAHFAAYPLDDPTLRTPVTSRRRLQLVADAPGSVAVVVEYTFQGRTVNGTRTLRIDIDTLAEGTSIAADGTLGATEDQAVGPAGDPPNPIYLVTTNIAGVDYGADPNNKKMLIVLEKPFLRLTAAPGVLPGLQVVKAFDPASTTGRHRVGRALLLTHATMTADRLGASTLR